MAILLRMHLPLLLILILASLGKAEPDAQNNWYNPNPNGQVQRLTRSNGQPSALQCGSCPGGTQREAINSNFQYCGRCVQIDKSCAQGNVLVGNKCEQCPCPGTGERKFGTSCRVDTYGQIVCDCPPEYTGQDCSQCAPGTVQSNQYPYNCLRYSNTNSQTPQCPAGNVCNPPTTSVQVPQIQPPRYNCPTQSCQPTSGCNVQPTRPNPWPQPQPQPQPSPCPVPLPGPGPILCPNPPQIQCPPTSCPPTGGNGICPSCPPTGGNGNCPIGPINCPPVQCPSPCPPNQPCPQPTPVECPTVNCPSPCQPTPEIPACPQCPSTSCPSCPQIPACPQCPQVCPQCPAIPPCNQCPSPCAPCPPSNGECKNCPNPCQKCPDVPSCPNCELTCPSCPSCPGVPGDPTIVVPPCICDPRGTMNQYGSNCNCKNNVEGYRCDSCKSGYFALTTDRKEGCLQCWGSGVSSYCTAAIFYRTYLRTSRDDLGSIELLDEKNIMLYNKNSPKFSWNGDEARLSVAVSTRLFWSLPPTLKGNRLTSYGGTLRFSRMFTGSGSAGADNDIMIVGGNGAMLIYSSFGTQASGEWKDITVLLDETEHWVIYRPYPIESSSGGGGSGGGSGGGGGGSAGATDIGPSSSVASRFDILEVLADVQLILIRATFTSNTMSTSIKGVMLASVSTTATTEGLVLVIERARCPGGYQGLSCESCARGYYRDVTDMNAGVFGACKFCPCGRNSVGCHLSYGLVVCTCRDGFSGDRCQDKEVITVTLDPFGIREYEGTQVDFTCTFTTNSKRTLLMRLSPEDQASNSIKAVETNSLTKSYKLSRALGRIRCEIVDQSNLVWAIVYAAIQLEISTVIMPPPPRAINLVMKEEFLCVDEGEKVEMSVTIGYYGSRKLVAEWRKEGNPTVIRSGDSFVISSARISDSGVYLVSAADGSIMGVTKMVLLVRKYPNAPEYPFLGDDPAPLLLSDRSENSTSAKTSNSTLPSSKTNARGPDVKPQEPRPSLLNSMQKDQPPVGYPVVIVSPEEVRVKVGETVTLSCNVSGEEPMKFYWRSGSNDYIPVHVRVSRGALIFKSILKQDQGSYYCVAWNNLGQVTGQVNIIVEEPKPVVTEAPLTITISQKNILTKSGSNIYFDCSTNLANVTPIWSRKTGDLPLSSEVKQNGTLVLYRVNENVTGSYICKAQTPLGQSAQAEATLGLIPIVPPAIPTITLNPKSPLKVRSGEKVRVECRASGYPIPNISWSRSIEGSDKKLVSSEGNMTVFEIVHVTKSDEGKYTCLAANEAGNKSESLSLVIDDAIICTAQEFRCKSGDQCVPKEDRCDNEKDCNDGSDEVHCKKRSRRFIK